ncbi:MAG: hypothetical protein ACRC1P_09420 [Cellulosilyticaceae bacterium]
MKITNTQVYGFEAAIRGMRNPLSSWHLSDSHSGYDNWDQDEFIIGQKDLDLAQRLIKGGSEHCKFLRQIHVWADMDMPRYWWSEMDTYHYNTKNSTSTMHRLLNNQNPITLDLFVWCEEDKEIMKLIIHKLEQMRQEYLVTKDNRLLVRAKRLLPEGFLQMRTMDTNYAELRNIYFQRRHHRLKEEWVDIFCSWVEGLPYAKELIMYEGK